MINKFYYLLSLAFVISINTFAQSDSTNVEQKAETDSKGEISPIDKSNYNSWAVTVGLGNVYTMADLASFGAEKKSFDLGVNLGVTKMFNSTIGVEIMGLFGKTHAYPNKYHATNEASPLYGETETTFITGNLNLVLDLSNLILTGRDEPRKWNVNAYTGVGYTIHNAYFTSYKDSLLDQDWGGFAEGYNQYTRVLSIPLGLGVKYRLSKTFDIEIRETATFYNDSNFDGRDSNMGGGRNDKTFYTSLSLVWKIGKKDRSLEWTNPLDDAYANMNDMQDKVDNMGADSDGDGVPDTHDVDNETPAGVMVAGNGRALDSDQDGIPDYKDVDPFTPLGASVDEYGKELDSDKDGIGDSRDREPDSKEGAIVNWQGVTVGGGNAAMLSELIPSVFFKFDSDVLEKDSEDKLIVIAKILKKNPDVSIDVIGYSDQNGDVEYNKKLGERRSQTVIDFLVKNYGVDGGRMNVKTAGADEPLSDSKDYYKNNRRVDFKILD